MPKRTGRKYKIAFHKNINEYFLFTTKTLPSADLVNYGPTRRVVTLWIFDEPLGLLDARKSIPVDSEHNEARPITRRELDGTLSRDREIGSVNELRRWNMLPLWEIAASYFTSS